MPLEPADELEAILVEENEALRRSEPAAAGALLGRKLAAAKALRGPSIPLFQAVRLRALAAENRDLLQQAIDVQGQIIAMVVRAAQAGPGHARYGSEGRAVAATGAPTVARQA